MGGREREVLVLVLLFLDHRLVVQRHHVDLAAVLGGEQRGGVRVDLLVDRHHHPHAHELGDEVGALEVHLAGEVGHRDALGDRDLLGHRVGLTDGLLLDLETLLLGLQVLALRVLDLPLGLGEELLRGRLLVLRATGRRGRPGPGTTWPRRRTAVEAPRAHVRPGRPAGRAALRRGIGREPHPLPHGLAHGRAGLGAGVLGNDPGSFANRMLGRPRGRVRRCGPGPDVRCGGRGAGGCATARGAPAGADPAVPSCARVAAGP